MRTTIRLEGDLLRRAKARAASNGQSLNDFISEAVRSALARSGRSAARVELPTFGGLGLRPGVDIDDNSALLDYMDEAEESLRAAVKRVAERGREKKSSKKRGS
jgi:hypothetical protein